MLRPTFLPILGALLLVRATAAARDAELSVSWQAPTGCPAYSDVESWLQAVIPPDARERLGELDVQVVITREPGTGFSASVRVRRGRAPGESAPSEPRVVKGPACEEVARSAIVVVSVAMSDALRAAPPPPPPAEAGATPAVPPEPATLEVRAAPFPGRTEPATKATPQLTLFTVAVGAGSGFAEQPGRRVDASALFALSRSVFIGPRLHALPSVMIRRDEEIAELHFVAAGPELCALPELSPSLHALACGRLEGGWAWSEGTQSGDPSDSGPMAALAVSPGLSVGRAVRVLVQADLELRLLRPRFERVDGRVLASLPLLAASGLLGVSLALP